MTDDSLKYDKFSHRRCDEWADLLALTPEEELSPVDHAAFLQHVQSCASCTKMRKMYPLITAYARRSLMVTPLPRLPSSVLEAMQKGPPPTSSGQLARLPLLSFSGREEPLRKRVASVASLLVAVCIVFSIVLIAMISAPPSSPINLSGSVVFKHLQDNTVSAVAWSPDGKYVAWGSWDHTVEVWNVLSGVRVTVYTGHGDIVNALAWSPDGQKIASGSADGTVQVWDALKGQTLVTYRGHSDGVSSLAWSPDGNEIASGSWDHTVQIWQSRTARHLLTHIEGIDFVNTLAWSPDGQEIASGGADAKVQIWNARTGKIRMTCKYTIGDPVDALAWSPDGQEIAFGGRGTTVEIWDARDTSAEAPLLTYRGHSKEVEALAWSPDGNYIASGSADKTIQVWEAKTGVIEKTYGGHSDLVDALAWSPDGKKIISGSWDNTVQIWKTGF